MKITSVSVSSGFCKGLWGSLWIHRGDGTENVHKYTIKSPLRYKRALSILSAFREYRQ